LRAPRLVGDLVLGIVMFERQRSRCPLPVVLPTSKATLKSVKSETRSRPLRLPMNGSIF
jgi:hypothetical protein